MRAFVLGTALFAIGLSSGLFIAPYLAGAGGTVEPEWITGKEAVALTVIVVVAGMVARSAWYAIGSAVRAAVRWSRVGG